MYPLWKKDIKTSLEFPIILHEYYDTRGFQFSIPYEKHNSLFLVVLESVRKQTQLPFAGDVSLYDIYSFIEKHSKQPPLSAAPHSYLQAILQEAKVKIALFLNPNEAQNVFDEISKKAWDQSHFSACGVDINTWLRSLQKIITNRESFLTQIGDNKQDKRIQQLKASELVE
jgi:hypothetical protein